MRSGASGAVSRKGILLETGDGDGAIESDTEAPWISRGAGWSQKVRIRWGYANTSERKQKGVVALRQQQDLRARNSPATNPSHEENQDHELSSTRG